MLRLYSFQLSLSFYMMRPSKLLPLVLAASLIVFLAACDDPGGVGLGLIDEDGGTPASTSETLDLETFQEATISGQTANVLLGQTLDPVLNQSITAHSHISFLAPDEDDFEDGEEIDGAELRFTPTVEYGDTTGTIDFALRTIEDEWEAFGATSDTSLVIGEVIDNYSFEVGEGQVIFELPDEWLAQYEEVLRDTAMANQFFGFQLEAQGGNTIVSIGGATTNLFLSTTEGNNIPLGATPEFMLTTVEADQPTLHQRQVIQNVTGYGTSATVAFADTLANHSVNRAVLELPVDTTSLAEDEGYVRQEPDNLFVEMTTETQITIITLSRSAENPELFTSRPDAPAIRQFMQQVLAEGDDVDDITVRIFPDQFYHSVNPDGIPTQPFELNFSSLPLYEAEAEDCTLEICTPRLLITTTPID